MKMLLLSDGPMPPPPLSAWHPLQLKLIKYCMPRLVACGSPCAGFLIAERFGEAPGARWLTGTCMNAPDWMLPTVSPKSDRTTTLGCCACWDWGRLCWADAGAAAKPAARIASAEQRVLHRALMDVLHRPKKAAAAQAAHQIRPAIPRSFRCFAQ